MQTPRSWMLALLIALAPAVAAAGRLISIDPALVEGARASDVARSPRVVVPASLLSGVYLYQVVVESTDSRDVTLGASTSAIAVRFSFDGSTLFARRDGAADSEEPVRTFPARTVDGGLDIDVSAVATVHLAGAKLEPTSGSTAAGMRVEPGVVSWAQQQLYQPAQGEPVTIGVRCWITSSPADGYRPRAFPTADGDRVGFFRVNDTGDLATRWRPGVPVRVLLDPSIPAHLRDAVRRGVLAWNAPLRAATGREMLRVEDGSDPALVPGTPGVVVVHWFASDPGGYLTGNQGITLTSHDPRTGEIVGAQFLLNGPEHEESLRGTDATPARAQMPTLTLAWPGGQATPVDTRPVEPAGPRSPQASPADPAAARSPVDPAKLAVAVEETTIHEMGHVLGLEHNFKASADLANLRPGELTTSVMDYLAVDETPRTPGRYDEAAILYGYGERPVDVMGSLLFATDRHLGRDPDAAQFDRGDPLAFALDAWRTARRSVDLEPARYGTTMIRALARLREFVNATTPERSSTAFDALLASLTRAGDDPIAAAERQAAYTVLHSGAPEAANAASTPVPYVALTNEQRIAAEEAKPRAAPVQGE